MRKITCLLIFAGLFAAPYQANAVGRGNCVPSECGAAQFVPVAAGAVAGSTVGRLYGLGGMIVGGIVGAKLGGKIQISNSDEYIKLSNGKCFECDTCQVPPCNDCGDGKYVTNGGHVYRCSAGLNDKWQDYTSQIGFCTDSPIKKSNVKNVVIEYHGSNFQPFAGQGVATADTICIYAKCPSGKTLQGDACVSSSSSAATCPDNYKDDFVSCLPDQKKMGATKCYRKCHNDKKGATTLILECKKGTHGAEPNAGWKGPKGEKLYAKCVADASTSGSTSGATSGSTVVPQKPTCRDGRTTANGKACCDTGRSGVYDEATDTCTCSGNMKFVIENGRGYCRKADGTIAPTDYDCDASLMSAFDGWKKDCAANSGIVSQIMEIEQYCQSSGRTEDGFMALYTALLKLNPQNCTAQPEESDEEKLCKNIPDAYIVDGVCKCKDSKKELDREARRCVENAGARVDSIIDEIDSMRSGLNVSKWKDKNGNFNTARLASDSIAGVVLGTAGGLITSNVIKKNQLNNGFDDIHCTVGGQTVADYGDEFKVGLQ